MVELKKPLAITDWPALMSQNGETQQKIYNWLHCLDLQEWQGKQKSSKEVEL